MAAVLELTDVESVRAFMQKTAADRLQDEEIEVLIPPASRAIQDACNREFGPAKTETRRFSFVVNSTGRDTADLKPYEFRAVSAVVADPEGSPVALTSSDYRLWPLPSREGTYFGLELNPETIPAYPGPYGTRVLDVTADWGMTTVPEDVEHWANATVEAWLRLRRGEGAVLSGGELQYGGELPAPGTDDLPLPVRRGLRRWMRPTPSA